MSTPWMVAFAGVPGTSKSIIAQYLATQFNVPSFSNDIVRWEVKEDMRALDLNQLPVMDEYERRSGERRAQLLAAQQPFILDASVDRRWAGLKAELLTAGYQWFLIDMELSRQWLSDFLIATGRQRFVEQELEGFLQQHQAFLEQHGQDVSIQLHDDDFPRRLELAEDGLRNFLAGLPQDSD